MAINYIVKTPGMLGGDPRIAGRRIGVHDMVNLYIRLNATVEEIMESYDLTPAQIYAALAYYYDHRDEIDAIIDENQRRAEAIPPDPRAAEVAARAAQREREDREKKNRP